MVDVSQQQIPFVCINPVCNSVLQQLLQYVAIEALFGGYNGKGCLGIRHYDQSRANV